MPGGFLLLEILFAGLILTAGIACSMYLFRAGFEHLERVDRANLLSAKLLQAGSLLKITDLNRQSESEDMGDGVTMKWKSRLVGSIQPLKYLREGGTPSGLGKIITRSGHNLFLYRVDFGLEYKGTVKDYSIFVFHSESLDWR